MRRPFRKIASSAYRADNGVDQAIVYLLAHAPKRGSRFRELRRAGDATAPRRVTRAAKATGGQEPVPPWQWLAGCLAAGLTAGAVVGAVLGRRRTRGSPNESYASGEPDAAVRSTFRRQARVAAGTVRGKTVTARQAVAGVRAKLGRPSGKPSEPEGDTKSAIGDARKSSEDLSQ